MNQAGYLAPSGRRTAQSFTVSVVDLLAATPDPKAGAIALQWQRYDGPGFTGIFAP